MLRLIKWFARLVLRNKAIVYTIRNTYREVYDSDLRLLGEISEEAKLYETTVISNRQGNNKAAIQIGKHSHVKGELMVMGYGGSLSIGEFVFVGEGTRIWSGERIEIGNHVLISHNVNIIDTNSHEMDYERRAKDFEELIAVGPSKLKGNIESSPITIEDHAWINFGSFIGKGVRIGKGAVIAPNSVVLNDVPAFCVFGGNPAKLIKTLA